MYSLNHALEGRGMRRVTRLALRIEARRGIDRSWIGLPSDWQFTSFSATNTQELRTVFRRPLVLNSSTNWESAHENIQCKFTNYQTSHRYAAMVVRPRSRFNVDFAIASRVSPREPAPSRRQKSHCHTAMFAEAISCSLSTDVRWRSTQVFLVAVERRVFSRTICSRTAASAVASLGVAHANLH